MLQDAPTYPVIGKNKKEKRVAIGFFSFSKVLRG
jgi:hypothetical protein